MTLKGAPDLPACLSIGNLVVVQALTRHPRPSAAVVPGFLRFLRQVIGRTERFHTAETLAISSSFVLVI